MWPFCRDFQLHMQFWRLDWIIDSFIQLAIANHEDCHFRYPNWNFARCKNNRRSKWSFSFLQCDLPQALLIVLTSESRMVSIFLSTLSNIIIILVTLVSILNSNLSHIQFKYSCPFKKTDHIRLTYLRSRTFGLNHLRRRRTTLASTFWPFIYLGSASIFRGFTYFVTYLHIRSYSFNFIFLSIWSIASLFVLSTRKLWILSRKHWTGHSA